MKVCIGVHVQRCGQVCFGIHRCALVCGVCMGVGVFSCMQVRIGVNGYVWVCLG